MEHVCPFCGEPPGAGVFCAACGRNLGSVERLPTRAEWEAGGTPDTGAPPSEDPVAAPGFAGAGDDRPLAERCAEATARFLAAMRERGCPGTTRTPKRKQALFRRAGHAEGWVVRPVGRDEDDLTRRYEPGLVLTTDGDWYRLDNEVRGHGTRLFPQFEHRVGAVPIKPPVEERVPAELAALLREHGA